MGADLWFILTVWWRFRCYQQRKVTPLSVWKWYRQFDAAERTAIRKLMPFVTYVGADDFPAMLLRSHMRLLQRLKENGYNKNQIIFMSFDEAGSSSAVVLNHLRDAAHLEAQEFTLLHSSDIMKIGDITFKIGEGVIVYVDDFLGSGKQLSKNVARVREVLQGNFIEIALTVCACEEASERLGKIGVEAACEIKHLKQDRPLHDDANCLPSELKGKLIQVCQKVAPPHGLGFLRMASMVVLSRNTPNNTPMILRGSPGQTPFVGLLPRTTDLKVPAELMYQQQTSS